MTTKLLLETLRLVDGGRVECHVAAPDGTVLMGVIENTFFDELLTAPGQKLSLERRGRIIEDNIQFLEGQAERLWREGSREIVIK